MLLWKHFLQVTQAKQIFICLFSFHYMLYILLLLELNFFYLNAGLQRNCCHARVPNWWYRWDRKSLYSARWGLGVNVCIKYLICMLSKPPIILVINHDCDLLGIYTPMWNHFTFDENKLCFVFLIELNIPIMWVQVLRWQCDIISYPSVFVSIV